MALEKCRECGQQVSSSARTCPHCGKKLRKTDSSGCLGQLAGCLVLILALLWVFYTFIIAPQFSGKDEGFFGWLRRCFDSSVSEINEKTDWVKDNSENIKKSAEPLKKYL